MVHISIVYVLSMTLFVLLTRYKQRTMDKKKIQTAVGFFGTSYLSLVVPDS